MNIKKTGKILQREQVEMQNKMSEILRKIGEIKKYFKEDYKSNCRFKIYTGNSSKQNWFYRNVSNILKIKTRTFLEFRRKVIKDMKLQKLW